jgi:hypothetical protein
MLTRVKCSVSLLIVIALLPACATDPSLACPRLPNAPAMDPAPPERSYQGQMQNFLQGSLNPLTEPPVTYELVKPSSKK